MPDKAAVDTVPWLGRVIDRSVRERATQQPVIIVGSSRNRLALDRLTAGIDSSNVGADGRALSPRISGAVGVHIVELIEVRRIDAARRRIRVWRQRQRDAVPPAAHQLGCQQLWIDLVLLALQEVFKGNDILRLNAEDS